MSSNDQRRKRGWCQEPEPSKRRCAADRYYQSDTSDSESEMEIEENDRRVFNRATEQERRQAAEVVRRLAHVVLHQYPNHTLKVLRQIKRILAPDYPGMPNDPRVVLQGSWEIVSAAVQVRDATIGHIWHRGFTNAIRENLARCDIEEEIFFDIHVGEAPLSQPSKPRFTSWVIQGRLLLQHGTRPGNPFVLCIFCGVGKPPLYQFLGPVCEEARELVGRPLILEGGTSVLIKPRAVLADAAARCYILGTVPQSEDFGCIKCKIRGVGRSAKSFRGIGAPRTHREFVDRKYDGTHRYSSRAMTPLATIPGLDLIRDVTVGDDRRIFHVGAALKFYKAFIDGTRNGTVPKIQPKLRKLLDTVLLNVQFPHERRAAGRGFPKSPVTWTPAIWGYVMDVVGIVVFNHVGQQELYNAYCLLHWAVLILNHDRFTVHRQAARDLLLQYETEHNRLFGYVSCKYHHFRHVPDDVKQFGSLPLLSTNPFEDVIDVVKHVVDVTKDDPAVEQAGTAVLLRERTSTGSQPNFPYRSKKGVKIRKTFMLENSANNTDSWFLAADGMVVKFMGVKSIDPLCVCGSPLAQQDRNTGLDNSFAHPIGLASWSTNNKKDLNGLKEYRVKDMICKLCIINMPTYTAFVPLPESFE